MKKLRFSISGLMAVVLVVAVGSAVVRALLMEHLFRGPVIELLICGAVPMAAILALGLIPYFKKRPEQGAGRLGLLGFEIGGGLALILYVAASFLADDSLHHQVGNLVRSLNPRMGVIPFLVVVIPVLVVPQLLVALLGGWLAKRYTIRVRVEVRRRPLPDRETGPVPECLVMTDGLTA